MQNMVGIPKYAASKRMRNEDPSQNLCNKLSFIYNHTICVQAEINLTDDILCEQRMMVSLNFTTIPRGIPRKRQ